MDKKIFFAKWLLRAGLAFVFAYAAYESFMTPDAFFRYIPDFMQSLIPTNIFLPLFGTAEIILVVWLLSDWKVKYASLIAFALMLGIVFFNFEYFNILFRNVAIASAALALYSLES
jgi:uncharacterized membrane protein YphA (DoxX/SURF4 family)